MKEQAIDEEEEDQNDSILLAHANNYEYEESTATKYLNTRDTKIKHLVEEEEVNLYESNDSIDNSDNASYGATPLENTQEKIISEPLHMHIADDYDASASLPNAKNEIFQFRADDSNNNMRKVNLSLEDEVLLSPKKVSPLNVKEALNELYGEELIDYFSVYFDKFIYGAKYKCNEKTCNLEYLQNCEVEGNQSDISNIVSDFEHSFSYTHHNQDEVCDQGIEFIKKIFSKNVTIKDLIDFNEGKYYGQGIINAYLRILEVYHEYHIAKLG
jgi:hypothetical protein